VLLLRTLDLVIYILHIVQGKYTWIIKRKGKPILLIPQEVVCLLFD